MAEDEDSSTDKKDAFIAVSNDNGASFNTKRLSIADPNGPTSVNHINNPVISGDNVYVTWSEDENANTDFDDSFISVSNDTGQTFNTMSLSITNPNGPTQVRNSNNLDLLPIVSGGNVYITWLEEDGNTEINDAFIAVSNDTGQTFNTIPLSITDPNGLTNAEHITNPVISGSNVYVTWIERTNATNGDKDAFIAVSNNNGQTFNTMSLSIADPNGPTRIDEVDQALPISPPIISGSNVYVTWDEQPTTLTGEDPFIAISDDNGQTFNTMSLSISNPQEGGTNFPVNSPIVSGNSVYVTWIEEQPNIIGESDAFIAISNDTGQTFYTTRLSILDPDGGLEQIILLVIL